MRISDWSSDVCSSDLTAEIAIKAAQTGHMVLSTLHTNSAAETLIRLHNMGIPGFNIATAVHLIIAQRLARKLCPHCKRTIEIDRKSTRLNYVTNAPNVCRLLLETKKIIQYTPHYPL